MSRRYDTKTGIFSPEGRLFQVEYAIECTNHAGSSIAITGKDGVILAGEKKVQGKLLDDDRNGAHSNTQGEKLAKVDDHITLAVAGLTSDANILIQHARVIAQRHTYTYGEPIPCEQLVQTLSDTKQGYTQYGGQRPFGVSFLYAGWDVYHGFQLYHSDPSGNYLAWRAHSIGQNSNSSLSLLKQEWKEDMGLKESILLAIQVLSKSMDTTTLTPEKLEFGTMTLGEDGKPVFTILQADVVKEYLAEAEEIRKKEEEEKEKEKAQKEREERARLAGAAA